MFSHACRLLIVVVIGVSLARRAKQNIGKAMRAGGNEEDNCWILTTEDLKEGDIGQWERIL